AIFSELFSLLARQATARVRRKGRQMLRLIDATPIPLGELVDWAQCNGRTRGLKLHVVYDPEDDLAERQLITPATVNDITFARQVPITARTTYVFDKAYCHYGWWATINQAKAYFVTRRKSNACLRTICRRPIDPTEGDGFTILSDVEVKLAKPRHAKLNIP